MLLPKQYTCTILASLWPGLVFQALQYAFLSNDESMWRGVSGPGSAAFHHIPRQKVGPSQPVLCEFRFSCLVWLLALVWVHSQRVFVAHSGFSVRISHTQRRGVLNKILWLPLACSRWSPEVLNAYSHCRQACCRREFAPLHRELDIDSEWLSEAAV